MIVFICHICGSRKYDKEKDQDDNKLRQIVQMCVPCESELALNRSGEE